MYETWVDDNGLLRHLAFVQKPGEPFALYIDGFAIPIPPYHQFKGAITEEIAEKFSSFVRDQPGWYRGTIDYQIDENGKVVRIDELKITMTSDKEKPA